VRADKSQKPGRVANQKRGGESSGPPASAVRCFLIDEPAGGIYFFPVGETPDKQSRRQRRQKRRLRRFLRRSVLILLGALLVTGLTYKLLNILDNGHSPSASVPGVSVGDDTAIQYK
jgi:hypothetical protein